MTACRRMPAFVAQRMTALSRLARVKGRDAAVGAAHHRQCRAPARAGAGLRCAAIAVGRARQRARHGRHHRTGSSSTASCAPRRCASRATTRCAAASSISMRRAWPSRCGSISSATRWRSIRSFDPETQRTTDQLRALDLVPVAEFQLTTRNDQALPPRLCRGIRAPAPDDLLYRRRQRRPPPSRHGALAAAVPRAARDAVRLRAGLAAWCSSRWPRTPRASGSRRSTTITRRASRRSPSAARAPPYQPLPPDRLYLSEAEWRARLERRRARAADAVRRARRAGAGRSTPAPGRAAISPPSAPSPAATCSRR